MTRSGPFSFQSRQQALERFRNEEFDILIIGGGITGAGAARDAASRGLRVALVEARDFAWGTSSRSSKLIHGGLRYLQSAEFSLVFEALSERQHLLKTAPHLVRPLTFYMPVYHGFSHSSFLVSFGLWLYDILSLFRGGGLHKRFSKAGMLAEIPFLKEEGLQCGFRYFDASMCDDLLCVDTLHSAHTMGAVVTNYVEALDPIWRDGRVCGFKVADKEGDEVISLYAKQVLVCAGPWTDQVGRTLEHGWKPWLSPSKGIHLVFDLKRLPIPGAMVMSHPTDGRISFVIPRPDYGDGVALVGTTDGPSPEGPDKTTIDLKDVNYLLGLLQLYFPKLQLTLGDVVSAYVGVRPLMGDAPHHYPAGGKKKKLQNVSREHYIGDGPGGVVIVAGGKYTTHRTMAAEIVDYVLERCESLTTHVKNSRTKSPINLLATPEAVKQSELEAASLGVKLPAKLVEQFFGEAIAVWKIHQAEIGTMPNLPEDPKGFPFLHAQLLHGMRNQMILHLEDFYLRRSPLYLARQDHGLPWAESLSKVWAGEMGVGEEARLAELHRLQIELTKRSAWMEGVSHV